MISVTLRDPFRTTFVVTSTRLGTNRTRSVRGISYRGLRPNATDYCRINPKFKSFFKRSRTPLIYVLLSVFSLSNLSFILIKSFLFELNNINFDSFFFFVADYTHLPVFLLLLASSELLVRRRFSKRVMSHFISQSAITQPNLDPDSKTNFYRVFQHTGNCSFPHEGAAVSLEKRRPSRRWRNCTKLMLFTAFRNFFPRVFFTYIYVYLRQYIYLRISFGNEDK